MKGRKLIRKCNHCHKKFEPYTTVSGNLIKKICKECKSELSRKNGKNCRGKKITMIIDRYY